MSENISYLLINPVFSEVLSGRFRPECEPSNEHTLNRLAVRTYQSGDADYLQKGARYSYTPSWAPEVVSGVDVYKTSSPFSLDVLTRLTLEHASGDRAIFEFSRHSRTLYVGSSLVEPQWLDLAVVPTLDEAQLAVTTMAEKFFRAV